MTRGELQLAQYRRDMTLDRLRRDEQLARDLLVRIAPRDQPKDFALARRQLVEFRVERGWGRSRPRRRLPALRQGGKGVEHEPRQPGRENRLALRRPVNRRDELGCGDRLGDVA